MRAQDKLIEARRLVSEVQHEVTDPIGKVSLLFATSELNTVLAVRSSSVQVRAVNPGTLPPLVAQVESSVCGGLKRLAVA